MVNLIFNIGTKKFCITPGNYKIEATYINKVILDKETNTNSINYKGKQVDVYDLGPLYDLEPLKKFDGLVIIHYKNTYLGIKLEGFFSFENEIEGEVLNIPEIIKKL